MISIFILLISSLFLAVYVLEQNSDSKENQEGETGVCIPPRSGIYSSATNLNDMKNDTGVTGLALFKPVET